MAAIENEYIFLGHCFCLPYFITLSQFTVDLHHLRHGTNYQAPTLDCKLLMAWIFFSLFKISLVCP